MYENIGKKIGQMFWIE